MTRNGNANGYAQVFKGPDGQPMVLLRAADFAALIQAASKPELAEFEDTATNVDIVELQCDFVSILDEFDSATDEDAYREDGRRREKAGLDNVLNRPGTLHTAVVVGAVCETPGTSIAVRRVYLDRAWRNHSLKQPCVPTARRTHAHSPSGGAVILASA